jgi:RimJ/RimL family protein N-acetyltransferase
VISVIPDDTTIVTERLTLTALTVDDADEMVHVLSDHRLHEFIGGHPARLHGLRERYRRFVAGPTQPSQIWLNWIVRPKHNQVAVGTLQATISTTADGQSSADVAWIIGTPWQNTGYATEAARSLVDWLRSHGADDITAHIHPDHHASAVVANRAGLHPTDEQHDGETIWRYAANPLHP